MVKTPKERNLSGNTIKVKHRGTSCQCLMLNVKKRETDRLEDRQTEAERQGEKKGEREERRNDGKKGGVERRREEAEAEVSPVHTVILQLWEPRQETIRLLAQFMPLLRGRLSFKCKWLNFKQE